MKNIKKTAFTQICERSILYKTTLTTLLESSHGDDIKDKTNSICHHKLAKLVAMKRNTEDDSRFIDSTTEEREISREVVTDFLEFAGKVLLDDIRIENTINAADFEVLTVATN
tara:strand:- start:1043 stop:1381 length:339 start_codon:yes stop_codon:yes gene_type:complete